MLSNSYSYDILYEQFHWIYLQGDVKLLLVTVNNGLKFEIEIVHVRIHYIVAGSCAKYCSQRVCMSVSPVMYLKNHTSKLHKIFCTCYLLWLQCNTLCTSSFVGDVMFSHNWVYMARLTSEGCQSAVGCDCGSVLLWQQCITFIFSVLWITSYNGPDVDAGSESAT